MWLSSTNTITLNFLILKPCKSFKGVSGLGSEIKLMQYSLTNAKRKGGHSFYLIFLTKAMLFVVSSAEQNCLCFCRPPLTVGPRTVERVKRRLSTGLKNV